MIKFILSTARFGVAIGIGIVILTLLHGYGLQSVPKVWIIVGAIGSVVCAAIFHTDN